MRLYTVSRFVDGRQWWLDIDGRQTYEECNACVFRSIHAALRCRDAANVLAKADNDPSLWYIVGWTAKGRLGHGKGSTDQ